MADEPKPDTTGPSVAPPAPAAEPAPGAAPIVAPAAPSPEPVAPALVPHTDTPTLLETVEPPAEPAKPAEPEPAKPDAAKPVEPPKPDAKPVEAAPDAAKPAEPAKPVEPAPEPIKYEAFKLPEGIVTDNERMTEYTTVLGKHRIPQDVGQELLDLHSKSLQNFVTNQLQQQHKDFANTRAEWRKAVMASDDLGGAGHNTAMGAVARMRDLFLADADPVRQAENHKQFNDFLRITGAGDHPWFNRMLYRAAAYFDEPSLPPAGAQPSPSNGRAPGKRRMSDIYNKPT